MNINDETGLIPASFDYNYINKDGEEKTTKIRLKIKRMSFRKTAQGEFQEAMKEIDSNPEKVAAFLVDFVDFWSVFLDDKEDAPDSEREMFPLTVDNVVERPPMFVSLFSQTVFEKLFPNPQKANR